jgi:hypothetical protein
MVPCSALGGGIGPYLRSERETRRSVPGRRSRGPFSRSGLDWRNAGAREGGGPARAAGPRERQARASGRPTRGIRESTPTAANPLGPRSGRTRVADRGRPGLAHHRLPLTKTARFTAGGFRSRFGPIGTGRGTCQKGPVRVARTAGGADVCGFARTYEGIRNRLHVSLHPAGNDRSPGSRRNRTFVQFYPWTVWTPTMYLLVVIWLAFSW